MGKYHVHRSDANAETVYAWLALHGASVARSGRPTDAIVGYAGLSVVVVVKTAKGALRPSQVKFLKEWRGAKAVVRCTADANMLLSVMAAWAAYIPPPVLEALDELGR